MYSSCKKGLYILDMDIYYLHVEVYVNFQVELMKNFNFFALLAYECNDVN